MLFFLLSLNSRRWHELAMYCFRTFCHGGEIKQPFPCRKSLRNSEHISGDQEAAECPSDVGEILKHGEWLGLLCSPALAPKPYPSPTHTSVWDSENGKGTKGFSREEHCSGLPLPSLWDLPDPGIRSVSLLSPVSRKVLYRWHHLGSPKWHPQYEFNRSVVSNSLLPQGLPHAKLPCPSPTPGVCSNSCPLSPWWPSHPLSSPSPPAFHLSQHQGLFYWVSSWYQVTKYWSFSFSNSPSNEYSGLIFFRIDRFDLLVLQGTLKSVFQHHSSKGAPGSGTLVSGTLITSKSQTQSRGWEDPARPESGCAGRNPYTAGLLLLSLVFAALWIYDLKIVWEVEQRAKARIRVFSSPPRFLPATGSNLSFSDEARRKF